MTEISAHRPSQTLLHEQPGLISFDPIKGLWVFEFADDVLRSDIPIETKLEANERIYRFDPMDLISLHDVKKGVLVDYAGRRFKLDR